MNYSYVMGIDNIETLKQNNFEIEQFGNHYEITFSDEKIETYEKFIYQALQNGFWNEYLGKEIVFIFKFKDRTIKKFVLDKNNEKEILNLCCNFAECNFSSIMEMLRENEFYSQTYFNK